MQVTGIDWIWVTIGSTIIGFVLVAAYLIITATSTKRLRLTTAPIIASLANERDELRHIFSHAAVGLLLYRNEIIVRANEEALRIFLVRSQEEIAPVSAFFARDVVDTCRDMRIKPELPPVRLLSQITRADGSSVNAVITLASLPIDEGANVLMTITTTDSKENAHR